MGAWACARTHRFVAMDKTLLSTRPKEVAVYAKLESALLGSLNFPLFLETLGNDVTRCKLRPLQGMCSTALDSTSPREAFGTAFVRCRFAS